MVVPLVCPASCGLQRCAAVLFPPQCGALPPRPVWPRPPALPSPPGSSPTFSPCRWPSPASRHHACLCRRSRPLGHPPPRRPPACKRPPLSIPPRVSSFVHNSSLYVSMRSLLSSCIQCDLAEFDQPCRLTQLQSLQEQLAECLQMALTEAADRSEVRRIKRNNHHESFR